MRTFIFYPVDAGPFHTRSYPLDLEPARKALVGRLNQLARDVARINYSALQAQLSSLYESVAEEQPEVSDALRWDLLRQATEFPENVEEANDCWFTLNALDLLASGATNAQISAKLEPLPWAARTEILARLSWIREQRAKLTKGMMFTQPFMCKVSDRNTSGRTVDREHYQLIQYLHGLNAETGERLVVVKRDETPDFVLADDLGSMTIGAEMSEAPVSQRWANEEDAASIVEDALRGLLARHNRNLLIDEPCTWSVWRNNLGDLQATLTSALAVTPAGDRVPVVNTKLAFRASLSPIPGSGLISIHDPRGQTAADLQRAAREMAAGIVTAVHNKLVKNANPRKPPSVRPCDLVLYPNGGDWADRQLVRQLAAAQLPATWSTFFDRIWLSSENYFGRLA